MNEITTTARQLTLYERLGKRTGIASLVDDIVEAHMNNPLSGVFRRGTPDCK